MSDITRKDGDALDGTRRGLEDVKLGRVRPARKALEEIRRKRSIPRPVDPKSSR